MRDLRTTMLTILDEKLGQQHPWHVLEDIVDRILKEIEERLL